MTKHTTRKPRGPYNLNATLEELFSARFVAEDSNLCWEWSGTRKPTGYGILTYKGKTFRAHRLAWEFHNGSIPKGLCVLHHCDNPSCVNPSHLWLGTQADNMIDKANKGRQHRGESHPATTITEDTVRTIRQLHKKNLTYSTIAKKVGTTISTVRHILKGNSWYHIK